MSRVRRHSIRLACAVAVTLAGGSLAIATAGPAVAQSGGKKAAKPRSQVEDVPGQYIQLETLWVPVLTGRNSVNYHGLVARLYPADGRRYDACIAVPWAAEAVLIDTNETPLTRAEIADLRYLTKRFAKVIAARVGDGVFRRVEILGSFAEPDPDSALLSRTCK